MKKYLTYMHVLAGLATLSLLARTTRSEDERLEARVKAAFIYNFARFTEWPASAFASPKTPLVIGVIGGDPMLSELREALKGKSINTHPLVVQSFAAEQIGVCHILFVGASSNASAASVKKVAGTPVLTVGDDGGFTDAGGDVRFYLEDGKLRFEINVVAVERAGLQVSSKLLKLAKTEKH